MGRAASLALISAKVAGAVLEAGGKADQLFSGKREARELGHPSDFPGKLSVVVPIGKQPIRVFLRHFLVLAEADCSIVRGGSQFRSTPKVCDGLIMFRGTGGISHLSYFITFVAVGDWPKRKFT
jgi:hypothetical protein